MNPDFEQAKEANKATRNDRKDERQDNRKERQKERQDNREERQTERKTRRAKVFGFVKRVLGKIVDLVCYIVCAVAAILLVALTTVFCAVGLVLFGAGCVVVILSFLFALRISGERVDRPVKNAFERAIEEVLGADDVDVAMSAFESQLASVEKACDPEKECCRSKDGYGSDGCDKETPPTDPAN